MSTKAGTFKGTIKCASFPKEKMPKFDKKRHFMYIKVGTIKGTFKCASFNFCQPKHLQRFSSKNIKTVTYLFLLNCIIPILKQFKL